MAQTGSTHEGRVVAVTGGGGGIGSAIVAELVGQGATVVVVDPGGSVTGEPLGEPSAQEAIDRSGASALGGWAATESVTDLEALRSLFSRIVDRHGRLDAVVNPAGILRFPRFPTASQDDWEAMLDVHFTGYLNVLDAALPLMESAGSGRVVGFVSGAGLARTSPDAPGYGCAKRAVASLTWELRDLIADGIAVNAMSPIAATRMVTESMVAAGMGGAGLDLSAMPQPVDMGPLGAYLASDGIGWCRGHVVYSAGSEISLIGRPRLVEAVRTRDADFADALNTLVPVVLAPVEADQRTSGGTNPRFGPVFGRGTPVGAAPAPATAADAPGCLVVAGRPELGAAAARAGQRWGLAPIGVGAWEPFDAAAGDIPATFDAMADLVVRAERVRPLEAVIVALSSPTPPGPGRSWREVVRDHRAVPASVVANAGWLRAAAESAMRTRRPVRVVLVADAVSPAGRTTGQALAQLARSANDTPTDVRVDTFSIALESTSVDDLAPLADLAARLARADDAGGLRGAELAVREGWVELRSHPGPVATVSFGGPEIPEWVDAALREVVRP